MQIPPCWARVGSVSLLGGSLTRDQTMRGVRDRNALGTGAGAIMQSPLRKEGGIDLSRARPRGIRLWQSWQLTACADVLEDRVAHSPQGSEGACHLGRGSHEAHEGARRRSFAWPFQRVPDLAGSLGADALARQVRSGSEAFAEPLWVRWRGAALPADSWSPQAS